MRVFNKSEPNIPFLELAPTSLSRQLKLACPYPYTERRRWKRGKDYSCCVSQSREDDCKKSCLLCYFCFFGLGVECGRAWCYLSSFPVIIGFFPCRKGSLFLSYIFCSPATLFLWPTFSPLSCIHTSYTLHKQTVYDGQHIYKCIWEHFATPWIVFVVLFLQLDYKLHCRNSI